MTKGENLIDNETFKAIKSVLFHWFECEHGKCGKLDLAMKELLDCSAAKPFRDYLNRMEMLDG